MAHGLVRRESVDTEMHKSGDKRKTFVFTKKRGYDVTRNPHLNKVSGVSVGTVNSVCSGQMLNKLAGAFRDCGKVYNCKHTGNIYPQVPQQLIMMAMSCYATTQHSFLEFLCQLSVS